MRLLSPVASDLQLNSTAFVGWEIGQEAKQVCDIGSVWP